MKDNKKPLILIIVVFIVSTAALLFLGYILLSSNFLGSTRVDENEVFIDKEEHSGADPEKGLELAELQTKIPYRGEYFSIALNDQLGKFEVYIDPSNMETGTKEFYIFLSENGLTIDDFRPYYVSSSTPL